MRARARLVARRWAARSSGAILGGGKGAVLGGAAGAAGGTAAVMAGGRNPATLPAGTVVTARVAGPVTVQVEKE